MAERELADVVEVLPDRLYWAAVRSPPRSSSKSHYFSVDAELVYEPFFADFGPLKLSAVHTYCKLLEAKLADPGLADRRIVHYCANDHKRRANSACLICLFQVIALGKTPEEAFARAAGRTDRRVGVRAACGRAGRGRRVGVQAGGGRAGGVWP